jgi:hypothetical protein
MSESRAVELYENEMYSSGVWVPDEHFPWTTHDNMPSKPPDELIVPSNEWSWESNWRIIKKPGATDRSGWEFA